MHARIQPIDLIKVIAMFAVIGLHTTGLYNEGTWLGSILYKSCVVAIPLFFMASGFLLLGRDNITYRYAFKKIFNIVRYVFTLSVSLCFLYVAWNALHPDGETNIFKFLAATFLGAFIQQGYFSVFWYLGAMCIVYLALPLLNRLYHNCKAFLYLFAGLAAVEAVVFIVNLLWVGGVNLSKLMSFRLSGYGIGCSTSHLEGSSNGILTGLDVARPDCSWCFLL